MRRVKTISVLLGICMIIFSGIGVAIEDFVLPEGLGGIEKVWLVISAANYDETKTVIEKQLRESVLNITVVPQLSDADCLIQVTLRENSVIVEASRLVRLMRGKSIYEFWVPVYRRAWALSLSTNISDILALALDDFIKAQTQ